MADAHILEYDRIVVDMAGNKLPVPPPPIATQKVTFTTATASAAFNDNTTYIRIVCSAKGHFSMGVAPTADADDAYFPADLPEFVGVQGGHKISLYDGTS